ncbi:MAG: hypothetical protein ACP5KD_01455 [Fervidobacterium sp.]
MKKFLTVLVALFVFVSLFAVEKPFTLGPVTYTGKVSFSLVVTKDGVDISGALLNVKASLSVSPTSDTQAGATFSISYSTIGEDPELTLKSITFSTPYFAAYYSTDKQFVSKYFTGLDSDDKFTPMSDFADSLKVTFPSIAGLEVYYFDKTSEGAATWFSDMVLAKYVLSGWEVVGGFYNVGNTYEFGGALNGSVDLGIFKPNVTIFAGMVNDSGMAYDFSLSGSFKPIAELTLTPTVKFAENLDKLDYASTDGSVANGKYVSLGVKYEQTFAPVSLVAQVKPKYDFVASKFTLPLNELSAKVAVTPVTLFVKTTNADVLDNTKKYTLYVQGDLVADMFSLTAKAMWNDVTAPNNYNYIHAVANATVDMLKLTANYRMTTSNSGYNASACYRLTENTKVTAFFGTLTGNDTDGWKVLTEPTWNVKLTYTASF